MAVEANMAALLTETRNPLSTDKATIPPYTDSTLYANSIVDYMLIYLQLTNLSQLDRMPL